MKELLNEYANKIIVEIGEYEDNTYYSNENQEYTKLQTLKDVQDIVLDVLQEFVDKTNK